MRTLGEFETLLRPREVAHGQRHTQAGTGPRLTALEQAYALPAGKQMWFPREWRPSRMVQRESRDGDDFHSFCQSVLRDTGEPCGETFPRREGKGALRRRLDDLVTDASDPPSPSEPCALPNPTPRPRPCCGRCALTGVVFWNSRP